MFNKTKRALSVVLVVLMVFMIMPLAAAVKETENPKNNVTVHKVIPENTTGKTTQLTLTLRVPSKTLFL